MFKAIKGKMKTYLVEDCYICKQENQPLAGIFLNLVLRRPPLYLKVYLFLVEAGGVEPPSEKVTTGTSPGADRSLDFAASSSADELALGYLDDLSIRLRELANERPGFFDARPGLPG